MKKALLFLFLLAPLFLFSQQIHYVKSDATGANTGLNWQDAFTDLQSALQIADYGDDIWVAAGTYKPTQVNDRTVTFDLPVGVRLAGGFTGTEALFGERDWAINNTYLSGDIGNPGEWGDNSYHVVRIYGGDTLTVLDGFRIMHGKSGTSNDPAPQYYGGGVLVWADEQRPVCIPLIQNCTIERNYASSGGGIACISRYDEYTSSPDIKNCVFLFNRGENRGGALSKSGKNWNNKPFKIENCEFTSNYCTQFGGAVAITGATGEVHFKNSRFVLDSTLSEGGGIYLESRKNIRYLIENCSFLSTFTRNGQGGGIDHIQFSDTAILIIKKSYFAFNTLLYGTGGAVGSSSYGSMQRIIIEDSTRFENNGNAAIYVSEQDETLSDVLIDRCFFTGNKFILPAQESGGSYFYEGRPEGSNSSDRTIIKNSIFLRNKGVISSKAGNSTFVNCTFLENGTSPFIKRWYTSAPWPDQYQIELLNSIIWEVEAPTAHSMFFNDDSTLHNYLVEYSLVNLFTCEYSGVNPCGTGMLYETPPQFVSTDPLMPDLSVSAGSPGVNKGSNAVVDTFEILHDYLGNPRILQDTVDMGAYETDASSNILEPFFEKESFLLQVTPNILSIGQPVLIQLFNLSGQKTFAIRLLGIDGQERHRQILDHIAPQVPMQYAIPTNNLPAGLYFLSVEDSKGRRKTEKVILR